MEELVIYRRTIINRSFWAAAGFALIASVLHHKDYGLGIVVGVLVAAVSFLLLSFQVAKLGRGAGRNSFLMTFLVRYGLVAIALFGISRFPQINIFGFLIGYLVLQFNLFIAAFTHRQKTAANVPPAAPGTV